MKDDIAARIAALTDTSKGLSRQIGEAKRNASKGATADARSEASAAADELIARKQALQAQIAELESESESIPEAAPAPAPEPADATEASPDIDSLIPPVYPADHASAATATRTSGTSLVARVESTPPPGWDEFVQAHPRATLYHESIWLDTVAESMGHEKAFVSVSRSDSGSIAAVLPLIRQQSKLFGDVWTSVPLVNYGGALAQDQAAEKAVLQAGADFARQSGAKHLEVRGYHQQPLGWPARTDKVNMWLALPQGSKALWSSLSSKLRSQVRKGQKNPHSVSIGGVELLEDYYAVFSENMRDLGTPVYGKGFFASILQRFGDRAKLVVVYDGSKKVPASCGFLVEQRSGAVSMLEIPWASTRQRFNTQNMNMVMYWAILEYAADNDFSVFDFGRSSKDAGTYRFKKQWGAQPVQLYWHYALFQASELPAINNSNPKFRLLVAVWQRLPLWIANRLGPSIVKYIP